MQTLVTFDEMKELYEFSLSANGLKGPSDGPEREVVDTALVYTYQVYETIGDADLREREAALLALFAVLTVHIALDAHRKIS